MNVVERDINKSDREEYDWRTAGAREAQELSKREFDRRKACFDGIPRMERVELID